MNSIQQELVVRVYDHILQSANTVLRNCKLFSIEILKLEDPTYAEIANQLKGLCDILDKLQTDDPDMRVLKAHEYADHVRLIAAAIEVEDEDSLNRHVEELDRRSFL